MPAYKKRRYKKRKYKKKSNLTKRVKKLENMNKNIVERNYLDSSTVVGETADVGMMNQDPLNLDQIIALTDATHASPIDYGTRIGPKITLTSFTMKFQIKFGGDFIPNRWQRVRVILFTTPRLTGTNIYSNEYAPSDILSLGFAGIDPTLAFYRKNPTKAFRVIQDKVVTVGNPVASYVTTVQPASSGPTLVAQRHNYVTRTVKFKFPKGLPVEYDTNGHAVSNRYRLMIISQNDIKPPSTDPIPQPDIHYFTRVNYIM